MASEYKPRPLCEICGERPAEFVCKDCGRLVCRDDFDPVLWVCIECKKKYVEYYPKKVVSPAHVRRSELWKPTIFFIIGIFILFIGFALLVYPEVGYIYTFPPLPISSELLSIILITLYVILILLIFIIFLKYFWARALY